MISLKQFYLFILTVILIVSGYWAISKYRSSIPLIPREVLFGNPEKDIIGISPDGHKLAYIAPRDGVLNIWIKTIGQNDDRPVTNDKKRGIHDYSWAGNNKYILYSQDKNGDENYHIYKVDLTTQETKNLTPFEEVKAGICAIDNKHFPNEILITMNKENPKFFDVYHLDLISGKLELTAKNPGDVQSWLADSKFCIRAAVSVKPDGSKVLLVRENKDSNWKPKLTWDFEDAQSYFNPNRPLTFSLDGNFLYLIDSTNANTSGLVKMNLTNGKREILASDENYDIHEVLFDQDTYEPIAARFIKDRSEWIILNPKLEEDFKIILSTDKGDLTSIDRYSDQAIWILGFTHDDGPYAYYLYNQNTKKIDFLFYEQPNLTKYKLAKMKPITFKSRDSLTIHGYLTCPLNQTNKKLPLVLNVHGGPWIRNRWGYHSETQWFANRGYACLQINFRGSSGYGKQFLNAGNKEWGGKMQDDLIDAVNWAISEGIADAKKIAIFGASYGGYAALVGATFTPDIFCCAVDMCGPSNLITMQNSISPHEETYKTRMYKDIGNPETEAEFLKSRSPLFKVNQIKIPILIAQGANDPRVKQEESEQIVAAIKAKGLKYEYLLFPDEGHFLIRPENRLKFYAAAEKFLAKHLGGRYEE